MIKKTFLLMVSILILYASASAAEDEPPWTSLEWVSGFDKNEHPDKTRLLNPGPGSYVLVFPNTPSAPAAPAR